MTVPIKTEFIYGDKYLRLFDVLHHLRAVRIDLMEDGRRDASLALGEIIEDYEREFG